MGIDAKLLESGSAFAPHSFGGVECVARLVGLRLIANPVDSFAQSFPLGSNYPAWKLLITATLPTHEIISLITTIFSNSDQSRAIRNLSGDDAQAFVDRLEGVSSRIIHVLDGVPFKPRRFCPLGIGWSRAADTQEVPTLSIRHLWQSSLASDITGNPTSLQSSRGPGFP